MVLPAAREASASEVSPCPALPKFPPLPPLHPQPTSCVWDLRERMGGTLGKGAAHHHILPSSAHAASLRLPGVLVEILALRGFEERIQRWILSHLKFQSRFINLALSTQWVTQEWESRCHTVLGAWHSASEVRRVTGHEWLTRKLLGSFCFEHA